MRRHGARATARRAFEFALRAFANDSMVLYYCDLSTASLTAWGAQTPGELQVARIRCGEPIPRRDWDRMVNHWNPRLATRSFAQRFDRGACVWLLRRDGDLAAYGWTLRGATFESHYVPLGVDDVHLFDFWVAPEYRGLSLNPALVRHVLHAMATEGCTRAFIESSDRNAAQLTSLRKTPFRELGAARKLTLGRTTLVAWSARRTRGDVRGARPG